MLCSRWLLAAAALGVLAACGDSSGPNSQGNDFSFDDPTEDTLFPVPAGNPRALDVVRAEGSILSDAVELTLVFATTVTPWSTGQEDVLDGFVDFDVDQNPATGIQSAIDESGGDAGIGADFYISLRDVEPGHFGLVDVQNAGTYVPVPVTFASNRVTITVPLNQLNNDDGNFWLAAVVGTLDRPVTDFLPNNGHLTVE